MRLGMQRARVRITPGVAGKVSLVMRRPPATAPAGSLLRASRGRLALAVAGAALALSGCQVMSPIQTDEVYMPADGVGVELGTVEVRDLVVVGTGKDRPGTLSGAMSNTSGEAQRVGFALADGQPVFTEAKPYSQERISGETQVQLASVPAEPGGTVTLTIQSQSAPAVVVTVPVVPAAGYYETVSPTAAPSTTATVPGARPSATTAATP
jgi:hypothetical protein